MAPPFGNASTSTRQERVKGSVQVRCPALFFEGQPAALPVSLTSGFQCCVILQDPPEPACITKP